MHSVHSDAKANGISFEENAISVHSSSRRDFIKRVIASGTAASTGIVLGGMAGCSGESNRAAVLGSVERLVTLNINGRVRCVDVLNNETLAQTLRYKLGLTGTKIACDRGECGACTVVVDGIAYNSCSMLTHSVLGRAITTVEGLESPTGLLHPIQQAMIDELGPQCGFCTPGQIMSAFSLLQANPKPTREAARQAMAGNLCRCGAYDHYLNAVMRASLEMPRAV